MYSAILENAFCKKEYVVLFVFSIQKFLYKKFSMQIERFFSSLGQQCIFIYNVDR